MGIGIELVTVTFIIDYQTEYGNWVGILGSSPELGEWFPLNAKKLTHSRGSWSCTLSFPRSNKIEYKYVLLDDYNHVLRWESGSNHILEDFPHSNLEVHDIWKQHDPLELVYTSAAFQDVVFKTKHQELTPSSELKSDQVEVLLHVNERVVGKQEQLILVGSVAELGDWKDSAGVKGVKADNGEWTFRAVLPKGCFPCHFKVVIQRSSAPALWEKGPNRSLYLTSFNSTALIVHHVPQFGRQWKGAGVAVPVFSLRSKNSFGCGEFTDLKLLTDWAVLAGLQLVQLLPINDTTITNTWWDSYPYSSVSAFALHPMYINLQSMNPPKEVLAEIKKNQHLNEGFLQYEETMAKKRELLHLIFDANKQKTFGSSDYQQFLKQNGNWLKPYALYSALRDNFGTPNFTQWPRYSSISQEQLEELTKENSEFWALVSFYFFIQYHLSDQLTQASQYAKSKGVILKGDLPIGVDPNSVECWSEGELFKRDVQVGAPPDAFSEEGQNWGFPAYNWPAMKLTDYAWWKQRLQVLQKYFHAFRIDHILGFFRIWEIPQDCVGGLLGRFNPSEPIWHWELENRGVWDFDRLTEPYIRDYHFDVFGEFKYPIRDFYFWEGPNGVYHFKDEFSSEVKIQNCQADGITKSKLLAMRRNVILLRCPDTKHAFYPRINLHQSDSYLALADHEKKALFDLYVSYFYQRQDSLWRASGFEKLQMLQSATDMLVCGEDLGMIPDCVPPVMEELSFLGLRIQRMPADDKISFSRTEDYPYLTVCTPSVHDTSTLREWWEEDPKKTKEFYNQILNKAGDPPQYCEPEIVQEILYRHFASQSMWAIICLQDFFALNYELRLPKPQDERINVPANRHHYWKYRMQLNLEDLIENHSDHHKSIRQMIADTDRLF